MNIVCESCGREFLRKGSRGRVPRFCGQTCRKRASRSPGLALVRATEGRWVRAVGKRPVVPSGAPASSTDVSTWSSFADVQVGAGDGFGVMLGSGIGAYDLDGCIDDGVLAPWARDAIENIPEPVLFMERSVSGRGVHVFVEAPEGRGTRRGGIERYTRARFIRCTFDEFKL